LHAFIYSAPPGSAFFNAVEKGWDTTTHLTAAAVDLLAILAWQNTTDAHERFPRKRPKPIPRPDHGDKQTPETAPLMSALGGMSASVMSVEEFQRRIEERRSRGA
jgi:hypothetical protein